jgi:hypothetical protein
MECRGSGRFLRGIGFFLICVAISSCERPAKSTANLKQEPLSPDITVEFASEAVVRDGEIEFQVTFKNIGSDMDTEVTMFSKAFLVPLRKLDRDIVGQGLVLAPIETKINLKNQESKTVTVVRDLPSMSANEYFLGVTVNSRAAVMKEGEYVTETTEAQLNNVTEQMLNLGALPARSAAVLSGKYDLYHEVLNATIQLSGNTAMHRSRNILRVMEGADEIPSTDLWDNDISARFLYFRPADGKAFIGQYASQVVDKIWGAISWQQEFDTSGRNIHVDYYSNAPKIDQLAPGNYVLGVLMNVTDGFTLDSYPQNNLDLTAFDLSGRRVLGVSEEVMFDISLSYSHALTADVLGGEEGYSWTYEIENKPEWLAVTNSVGDNGFQLSFTIDAQVPPGIYRVPLTIQASKGERVIREETTLVFTKNDGPLGRCLNSGDVLRPTDSNVTLLDRDGIRWMTVEMLIENIGSRDLYYSVYQTIAKVETPSVRLIHPGAQHSLRVSVPLVGVPLPASGLTDFTVQFYSNGTYSNGYFNCSNTYDPKEMLQHQTPWRHPFVGL